MESVTFVFRSEKSYTRVWEALNDSPYHFASYAYKAITVFGEKAVNEVRKAIREAGIKAKEE